MSIESLLDAIEGSYFGFITKTKKKGYIPVDEKYRAFRVDLDIFSDRLDVVYGTEALFKAAFPDQKYHPSNGVTQDSQTKIYNLPILKCKDPVKIIGDILDGTNKIITHISESKGIENNETEAYLFGYICGNIIPKIIDYEKLYTLEKEKATKHVEAKIHNIQVTFHIAEKWKNKDTVYEIIGENTGGSCMNRTDSLDTHILIKPKKEYGKITRTNIYCHELYHMYRRLYPHLDKHYKTREDLIRELVKISYPLFIEYIK